MSKAKTKRPSEPRQADTGFAATDDAFVAFRRAVMDADESFQKSGDGGTGTWLSEHLEPRMKAEGLVVYRVPVVPLCGACGACTGDAHAPTCPLRRGAPRAESSAYLKANAKARRARKETP